MPIRILLCVCLSLFALVTPAFGQESAEDIIARHIEAHGGLARWKAVSNMKLTGDFTGFSITRPFSLVRTNDGKLRFDHYWADQAVIMGSTGQQDWWINNMMGKTPVDAPEWAEPQFREWADLATPLMDYKARGYSVAYLGHSDLEGTPALAIKLTREEGRVETWYLDPKTFLEIGRVTQGSDFGYPVEQITFFDDFRKVNGLVVPFLIETTYGTRHRVMEVRQVEFDVKVDPDLFLKPFPEAMVKLEKLVGEWEVEVNTRDAPNQPFTASHSTSVIEPMLDGNLFVEKFTFDAGQHQSVVRTWTHDQYRNRYTVVETSSLDGLADVLQGSWQEGVLSLDNLTAGTTVDTGQGELHRRIRITEIDERTFKVESDQSRDGGERWFNLTNFTYRKKVK